MVRTFNLCLKDVLKTLEGELYNKVKSGLKVQNIFSEVIMSTDGDNSPIQTIVQFSNDEDYKRKKKN